MHVKGTILSHFSRPKVTLKTIAKVNKLDAGTPLCAESAKPFSIVFMQYSQGSAVTIRSCEGNRHG